MLCSPENSTVTSGVGFQAPVQSSWSRITVVEPAEPPRDLRVQPPLLGGARLETVAPPVIGARRNDDAVGDLERRDQALAGGVHVELDAVPAAQAPVDRGDEHPVALPRAGQVGDEGGLELVEQLLEGPCGHPRAVVHAEAVEEYRPPRHEAERRVEVAADALGRQRDVPQVVRIVDSSGRRPSHRVRAPDGPSPAPRRRRGSSCLPGTARSRT